MDALRTASKLFFAMVLGAVLGCGSEASQAPSGGPRDETSAAAGASSADDASESVADEPSGAAGSGEPGASASAGSGSQLGDDAASGGLTVVDVGALVGSSNPADSSDVSQAGSAGDGPGSANGAAGSNGTTADGLNSNAGAPASTGGSGTTADGSGGGGQTDDGSGGTGETDDGSGGTGETDDGSGGTGATDDGSGGTGNTDDGSGGTGNTDDGSGGTGATDDGSGGEAGCVWVCVPLIMEGPIPPNVIVLNDAYLSGSDVEGRLFVGNDATFPSYAIGTHLPPDAERDDLIVGGDLVFTSGGVPNGAVAFGGEGEVGPSASAYGGFRRDTPIDFEQLTTDMLSWSDELAAKEPNGTVQTGGQLRLSGTDPTLNVFEVEAAALAAAYELVIDAPAGSTVVVNVRGTDVSMTNMGFSYTGVEREYVLFNMPDAQNVTLNGIGVQGSILAPRADLDFSNGNIDGQLVVNNFIGGTGESHPHYFVGCPWICV
jgi:choice-of-anchor A domain-containing protein